MKRKVPFLSRLSKSPFLIKMAGYAVRMIISLLYCTLRVRMHGVKKLKAHLDDEQGNPIIIALWHNELLLMAPLFKATIADNTFTAIISNSRDGEIPTAFARTYPQADVIRVGHQTKAQALLDMLKVLSQGRILVITPDGPRGPRCEIKPGVIFCAKKSGALIVPFSWQASKSIRLNTWDKFCIPLPFSKITAHFGEPFTCRDDEEIEQAQVRLKSHFPAEI